jgi:hypothetical protein
MTTDDQQNGTSENVSFCGKNITPNWHTTVSKAPSENGSAAASAGRKSTSSPGLNFVRATSSIGQSL